MKNFVVITLVLLAGLFLTHNISAEKTDTDPDFYYYAFVLSCGEIIYYTSPIELSDAVLFKLTADYEEKICGASI